MSKNKEEPKERVYPDPRYVYQHVVALGCDGHAAIGSVVVECTPEQGVEKYPADVVVDSLDAVLGIDPLITCTPTDKVYKDHEFDKMVDQYKKFNTRFISIVDAARTVRDFGYIEEYLDLPIEVRKLYTGERRCKVLDDGSRKMV